MGKTVFVSALFMTLALAGCTTGQGQVGQTPVAPSITNAPTPSDTSASSAPDPVAGGGQLPKSGDFISQGAATTGTVTIASTSEDEFSITLNNFSTGQGDDLRLHLSTGQLVQGADGNYYVDGNTLELPGKVDGTLSTQSWVFDSASLTFGEFRSFTVYDYANRIAFGSAALN